MTRGRGLNSKFNTVDRHGVNLGPRSRRCSPSGFFFYGPGCVLAERSPPPLEWLPFRPLVAAVFITPKGAESPGSGRVIGKGIPRGCQGLFTPVSLGYPLSVFNKNSTLKQMFELRETGDWDIFLGPPERASAETGGADRWVLKRRESLVGSSQGKTLGFQGKLLYSP